MGLLDRLRGSSRSEPDVHYECRDCGTSVADDVEGCPECGSSEIASYHV